MKYLLPLVLVFMFSCQSSIDNKKPIPSQALTTMNERAPFIHTVFFYLNEDVTADQKKAFEAGMKKLGTAPTISNFRIGKPAMTPRDIVDNNYGYSWIVEFKNEEDQNAYQTEPIHLEFIELYKDLWKEVKVYDSLMMN